MNDSSKSAVRPKVVVERTYQARVEELWELWTTKKGFESWWGPEGFRVEVHTLEARVGGALHYDMIADAPEQIEAMKRMGHATSHKTRGTFAEISPHARLAITHVIDFLPGVKPYDSTMVVELARPVGRRARDRFPAGREALRQHDGGGVLPGGRERAHGGHAGPDAQRGIHQDVDDGLYQPAHQAGQAVRGAEGIEAPGPADARSDQAFSVLATGKPARFGQLDAVGRRSEQRGPIGILQPDDGGATVRSSRVSGKWPRPVAIPGT